jgi:hypothetical protein
MVRSLICTAALVAALAGGVAAQAQPAARPACFYPDDISNFRAIDDHTLYLRVGVHDFYRLELMGHCDGLGFHERLAIRSTPAGSPICSPLDIEIISRDLGSTQRCPVTVLHALTPAEAAALPKSDRP